LASSLDISKEATQKANTQVKKLQRKIRQLSTTQLKQDTNSYVVNCVQLQDKVNEYINASTYTDSLMTEQVHQFEKVIENKDSMIHCYETDYSILQHTTDTLLVVNENLLQSNTKLEKVLKRRKQKGKIITGGALLLAGLVTATQLRSIN
jgi:hypothetical protein